MAVPLLAVAVAGGACGGGTSQTHSAGRGAAASSGQATSETQRRARDASPAWPQAKVLDRIAGKTVRVDGRRVRVDPATVTCGGEGRGSRRGRARVWTRFTCIQPTFGGGVSGPDVVFRVEPTGRRSFRITGQGLTRY
jgi:hypothetical protein